MIRALLAVALLAYVIPAQVVVREMAARRAGPVPLRIETSLSGLGGDWPTSVTFETHPSRGVRIADDRGRRWLLGGGRLLAGDPAPVWIPPLELLLVRNADALGELLRALGVSLEINQLGRCGDSDCFVLGGREHPVQVWVDKDSFDVRELRRSDGGRTELSSYAVWGEGQGVRLPAEVRFFDALGRVGTLSIDRVARARDLDPGDFSSRWVLDASPPGAPVDSRPRR